MTEEVSVLIWKDVGVWHEVIVLSSVLLLHLDVVEAQSVLSSDFIRGWEMVESLELVKSFVQVSLTTATGPQHVPFVRFSVREVVGLTQRSHQFGVTLQNFVKHLVVVNVVTSGSALMVSICVSRWGIVQKLSFVNNFEVYHLVWSALTLVWIVVEIYIYWCI